MDTPALSHQQLAGQRLLVGFDGTEFNSDLRFLIDTLRIGGIILFSQNLISPGQIKNLCGAVQDYAVSCGNPPLFIAVDQEGGAVARLKEPFTQFAGNPHMIDSKEAQHFAEITARELAAVGINMNMAPVLDTIPENCAGIMASRSFGHDPGWVSDMGVTVIEHLQQNSIMAVAKHFPGIGRTLLDSHLEMPRLDIDLSTMRSCDLLPFKAAIDHQVAAIMLSHILYPKIDPDWPASLSTPIARDLLRNQMAYHGVVMTDDLDMGAIQAHFPIETVIRQILSAGIDIALICHKGPDIEQAFESILRSLSADPTLRSASRASVARILALKRKYIRIS